MSQQPTRLRERKKRMTRESIAETTLQLALDKGLERTTIDEIARIAIVSPRTVANYFSSKEAAIAAAGGDYSDIFAEQLAARPSDEPPLESLCVVAVDFVRSLTPDQLELNRQKIALSQRYPSLKLHLMNQYEDLEATLRPALAARTGTNLDTDVYPWLIVAAAVAAIRLTMFHWASSGADAKQLTATIRTAFAELQEGLPTPPPRRRRTVPKQSTHA